MLFNAKAIPIELLSFYLTHSWGDKGGHTFAKGIGLKLNVIAQTRFELSNYDVPV